MLGQFTLNSNTYKTKTVEYNMYMYKEGKTKNRNYTKYRTPSLAPRPCLAFCRLQFFCATESGVRAWEQGYRTPLLEVIARSCLRAQALQALNLLNSCCTTVHYLWKKTGLDTVENSVTKSLKALETQPAQSKVQKKQFKGHHGIVIHDMHNWISLVPRPSTPFDRFTVCKNGQTGSVEGLGTRLQLDIPICMANVSRFLAASFL